MISAISVNCGFWSEAVSFFEYLLELIAKIFRALFGQPSQVLIYDDAGVSSAEECEKQLRRVLDSTVEIRRVDSTYLKTESWESQTIALVMGGGRCSQWDINLGDKGVRKIRDYVHGGGKYIGFCAGAYYACRESLFADLAPKQRALAFFSGRGIGPLTPGVGTPETARAAEVAMKLNGVWTVGCLYYQGGCYFEVEDPHTEIIAHYRDLAPGRAAAVRCRVQRGEALLFGLHPEYVWKFEEVVDVRIRTLAETLSPHEPFRKRVWREIAQLVTTDSSSAGFSVGG